MKEKANRYKKKIIKKKKKKKIIRITIIKEWYLKYYTILKISNN